MEKASLRMLPFERLRSEALGQANSMVGWGSWGWQGVVRSCPGSSALLEPKRNGLFGEGR